ncbi:MAG: hypothetical protein H7263_18305, partial [Candidatus Sericytochromatia bacterium]|nr:hypothetical protein [Candidatus Sericytochromatia bacterium]
VIQAVSRLPKLTMLCLNHDNQDTYAYIPIFPSDSMIEGIRLAKDNGLSISFIDLAIKDYKVVEAFQSPDDYAINTIGLEKFYDLNRQYLPKSDNQTDNKRESNMAFHLNRLSKNFERVLFIGGMAHWENIREHLVQQTYMFHPHELEMINPPFLAKPGDKALFSLLEEIPYLVFNYEIARRFNLPYDKWQTIIKLLQEVKSLPLIEEENYNTREMNNLIDYAKKLAHIDDEIIPDLYNLLLSAKQTLGDDYGIELLDLSMKYPFKEDDNLPIINLENNNFTMGGKKISLKRSLPDFAMNTLPDNQWQKLELIRKKKDEIPDDYISEWFDFGFYSHVPEDTILENFIDRMENKVINEMVIQPKIHEFSGSLMDGLELRETIRNFTNKKIYVKEFKKEKISIGAWLMIFDDELSAIKYPWAMSLSAEHHNESDIAFYATNPLLHPVSRQIIKAEYGALLAFKPPLADNKKISWEDIDIMEDLRIYQMTMLAIDLCTTNGILYIASKPPEPYFYKIAAQKNKKIYYLSLNKFSNRNLKKIKRFHLLKTRKTRNIADDYI